MISIEDYLSDETKTHLATVWALQTIVAEKALESLEQLSTLHMGLARANFEQANVAVRQLLSAQNMAHCVAQVETHIQPAARRVFDYGYYLTLICSNAQVELSKIIGTAAAQGHAKLEVLVAEIRKGLPNRIEMVASMMQAFIDTVHMSSRELMHITQRALKAARHNWDLMVSHLSFPSSCILSPA